LIPGFTGDMQEPRRISTGAWSWPHTDIKTDDSLRLTSARPIYHFGSLLTPRSHDAKSVVLPNRLFYRKPQWQCILYANVLRKQLSTKCGKSTELVADDIRFCHCKPKETIR
jgi:hypothetical protein